MLIFTDASYVKKPQMSGLGMVVIDKQKELTAGAYVKDCEDNNIAEVAAIAFGINYCQKNNIFKHSEDKTLTIITDSSYAMHRIQNHTPPRSELEAKCLNYIHKFLKESNMKVNFMQIKGHQHDGTKFSYYNNLADDLAGEYRYLGTYQYEQSHKKHITYYPSNKKYKKGGR